MRNYRYELVGRVSADIDCHEYLSFYLVFELAGERAFEVVAVEGCLDVPPTLFLGRFLAAHFNIIKT